MSDHSFSSRRDMVFEGLSVMILPCFRLFDIQGESVHSVWKHTENVLEHKSEEWLPHSHCVPNTGSPRLPFCLPWHFFFSRALVGLERRNNSNPQNPQQRAEGYGNGWPARIQIFQRLGAASFVVGNLLAEVSLGSHGGLCSVFVRTCLAICRRGSSTLISISSRFAFSR